jgi:N-acetylmuramic acid 6-phosphate etherase
MRHDEKDEAVESGEPPTQHSALSTQHSLVTESPNPRADVLDRKSTLHAARIMNAEDRRVPAALEEVLPAIARAVDGIVERLGAGGRLFYVGTGTSGRLGVLDAAECPPTFGVSPELVQGIIAGGYDACHRAVEASEDDEAAAVHDLEARGVSARDVVVGLAASGATPYTVGAVRWARARGALTIGVTCNPGAELEREAEIAIVPVVGPEVVAGSTRLKSGTAQKLVLNMLSTLAMVRLGYVLGNRMARVQPRNRKLAARAERTLVEECGVDASSARAALDAAGGDLATAIVMLKVGVGAGEARRRVAASGGSVPAARDGISCR